MNLVPSCEYESDDEDEEGEILTEEVSTESEVENLFKAFEEASIGELADERVSQFIASVDDSFRSSTGGASVRNNPRTSIMMESQHALPLPQPRPNLIFGSTYRRPQPLLTSSSKRYHYTPSYMNISSVV